MTIARFQVRYTAKIRQVFEAYNGGQLGVAEVLRCADRWGREVVLYEDTWYDKIVSDHAEVTNLLDKIVEVLAMPDRVNFDALVLSGENFYGLGHFEYPLERRYLKIVVRYEFVGGREVGTIVSAYPARDYRKHGERYKWHRR